MNDVWVSITKWTFFEKKNITRNRYKQDKKFWNESCPKTNVCEYWLLPRKKMQKLKSKYRNINVFKIRNKVVS